MKRVSGFLLLSMWFCVAAHASIPCHVWLEAMTKQAENGKGTELAPAIFDKAVTSTLEELMAARTETAAPLPWDPFVDQQVTKSVLMYDHLTARAPARETAISALLLVRKAGPKKKAGFALLDSLLAWTRPTPPPEPVLPAGYSAKTLAAVGKVGIERLLSQMETEAGVSAAQKLNWWISTVGSYVVWPAGLANTGKALFDMWMYQHIDFETFISDCRSVMNLPSEQVTEPVSLVTSVRNPLYSVVLTFHRGLKGEPVLLGSFATLPSGALPQ